MSEVACRLNALGVATPKSMVEYALDAENGLVEQIKEIEQHLEQTRGALIQVRGIRLVLEEAETRATN